ncbi:MAG: aldo/keto reductase, partial [Verrucomicrobiota bacterium]
VHFPIALTFVPFEERYPPEWFHDPTAENPAMKPIQVPYADTWGAMEDLQRAGLVKRIGVCNLNISLLRDVLSYAAIRPSIHQVELHPYLNQKRLLRYCQSENIAVTAFSPLGAESYLSLNMADESERVVNDPVVQEMASARERTPAQIVLRWALQRGTIPIPKSQSPAHLRENIDLFTFDLSDEEIQRIDSLERHRRFNDPADFGEKAFNTFYPIFD